MVYLRLLAAGWFVVLTMTSLTTAAGAGPVKGSDSIVSVNVGTSPTKDLLSSLTNGGIITFGTIFWSTGSGGMAGIPSSTPIADTSLTLTTAGYSSFAFTSIDGSFVGSSSITVGGSTFTPKVTGKSGSVDAGSETVGLYLVGTFTPAGSIASLAANTMSIALTLNENGLTANKLSGLGSFSASFTVATPATGPETVGGQPVSEPMSVVLLATGLLSLGAMTRLRTTRPGIERADPWRRARR